VLLFKSASEDPIVIFRTLARVVRFDSPKSNANIVLSSTSTSKKEVRGFTCCFPGKVFYLQKRNSELYSVYVIYFQTLWNIQIWELVHV
jgi:hypothetical protein